MEMTAVIVKNRKHASPAKTRDNICQSQRISSSSFAVDACADNGSIVDGIRWS